MENPDRRALLIGSGAALALATLSGRSEARPQTANHHWNHGDNPWEGHPASHKFDPDWVCILYMELMPDFAVKALRLHYQAVKAGMNNNWATNEDTVCYWINELNKGTRPPDIEEKRYTFYGLSNFKFHNPHHVIVYIKNKNIGFTERPVWFGELLQGTVKEYSGAYRTGPAGKNRSFFNTAIYENITKIDQANPVSSGLVYFENHLTKRESSQYKKIGYQELHAYSMKINVVGQSLDRTGLREMDIPIIIDPDTGNEGGGYPFLGP